LRPNRGHLSGYRSRRFSGDRKDEGTTAQALPQQFPICEDPNPLAYPQVAIKLASNAF
jgi:hypothetical protein